jgi:hypothetical protein
LNNFARYIFGVTLITSLFAFQPVMAQLTTQDHIHTIRCLTPIILEYESNPESRAELGQILGVSSFQEWEKQKQHSAQIMTTDTLMSASGRFRLFYDRTGVHAVPLTDTDQNGIPDYVERAGEYADSSWNHLVANLGFADPVPDLENPIKIRFQKNNNYGFYQHGTRTITTHNNFNTDPFPIENQDPEGDQLGALKVTIAHELKHAVQAVSTSCSNISLCFGSNWIEMDATMAEEVVYPNVKDYLNYLGIRRQDGNHYDIFLNPGRTVPFQYYQATFGLYYRERFGDQFWVDVWKRADEQNNNNLFLMMEQELAERGVDPDDEFITMYLWHMASGETWSVDEYGFKDKLLYPDIITTNSDIEKELPYASVWKSFSQRSANYFDFFPDDSNDVEELYLGLLRQIGTQRRVSIGLIYWMSDGSIQTDIIRSDSDQERFAGQTTSRTNLNFGFYGFRTPISPAEVRRIGVAVVNPASFPQSVQFVAGTNTAPSTNRLADFTRTTMNPDARTEAEALLDRVVLQSSVTQINNPLDLLAADVSANNRATAFDASMILQKGTGILSQYPADPDNELFVPIPSWYSQSETPLSSVFADQSISQVQNLRFESVFGNPDDPNSLDDTLRVYLISDSPVQFNSAQIEIDYDVEALFFDNFESKFSPSATFTGSRNSTLFNRLRLAFASDVRTQPSDTISTLFFTPSKDTTVTLTLRHLELEETFAQSFSLTSSADVRPSEGVSIERPSELPITTKLNPAYPNPFNPSTIIPFDISELSIVTVDVFDILGRRVASIVNDTYSAGRYTVPFNATTLASGIYLIQLTVTPEGNVGNPQRLTQRVTLIK